MFMTEKIIFAIIIEISKDQSSSCTAPIHCFFPECAGVKPSYLGLCDCYPLVSIGWAVTQHVSTFIAIQVAQMKVGRTPVLRGMPVTATRESTSR